MNQELIEQIKTVVATLTKGHSCGIIIKQVNTATESKKIIQFLTITILKGKSKILLSMTPEEVFEYLGEFVMEVMQPIMGGEEIISSNFSVILFDHEVSEIEQDRIQEEIHKQAEAAGGIKHINHLYN